MKNIVVVAGLICRDNKYFIAQRSYGNDEVINKWEFPGGKVEIGESEIDALKREIIEELKITVEVQNYLTNIVYKYVDRTIDLRLYKCKYIDGEVSLHDHKNYAWVLKNDFLKYDFAPADKELVNYIVQKGL